MNKRQESHTVQWQNRQMCLAFSLYWMWATTECHPCAVAANIAVVGLALFNVGFTGVGACVQLGIPMIVLLIIFSQAHTPSPLSPHDVPKTHAWPIMIPGAYSIRVA